MPRNDRRTVPAYQLEHLFRRFELTIPLRRPLVVRYLDMVTSHEVEVSGLPAHNRAHVLYVLTSPGRMVAIPKSAVRAIRALYPRENERIMSC